MLTSWMARPTHPTGRTLQVWPSDDGIFRRGASKPSVRLRLTKFFVALTNNYVILTPGPRMPRHPLFQDPGRDAMLAVRLLARRPGFAVTALLTLALGIGAPTAIFSVVHAVLLRPLPYPDADRIVRFRMESRTPRGQIGF